MSQSTVGALRVVLGLDSATFTDGLKAAQKHLRTVGKQMRDVGTTIATVGAGMTAAITLPALAMGKALMDGARDAAAAAGQVKAALASMGDGAGRSFDQLTAQAERLSATSLFDDDEILTKVTANLLTFGNVAGESFDRAQQAALDLSARMGGDLQSSTVMIGKALNAPTQGLAALRRVGIQFTEQQEAQIKAMDAAGNSAGAQAIMLGELERQFGGASAAARAADPMAAAMLDLGRSMGVLEQHFVPIVSGLAQFITKVSEGLAALTPFQQKMVLIGVAVAAAVGPALVAIGSVVAAVGTMLPLIGAIGLPLLAVAAAVVAVGAAFAIWGKDLMPIVQKFGKALVDAVGPTIPPLIKAMRSAFEALGPVVKFVGSVMISAFGPVVITALRLLAAGFTTTFNVIGQTLRVIGALIRGDWSGAWNAAGSLVMEIVKGIGSLVEAVFPGITENVRRMVDGVSKWLTGKLFDVLRGVITRVKGVSDAFFRLYDAVVGNSYVPDMVEGVAHWMAKLDAVMVAPAERATRTTAEAFQTLRDDVAAIMEGLLTDLERSERDYAAKAATLAQGLARGVLTQGEYDQARSRLDMQRADARFRDTQGTRDRMGAVAGGVGEVFGASRETAAGVFGSVRDAMGRAAESVSGALGNVSAEMEASGERFAQNFARTFEGILRGDLSGVLNDVLNSVLRSALLNVGRMLHGFGSQQGGVIGSLFKMLPGFATGGSFKVGGRAGVDQNLVAFRATKGEMVDIRRPGQDRGGSGAAVSFDLRGAVMTGDLLAQMERMASESGGAVLNAARAVIPAEQARKRRFGYA